jgi:hypothetical protein
MSKEEREKLTEEQMCSALSSSKTDEEIEALTKKVIEDYVLFQSS